MREILFRAKSFENEEFVYGDLIHEPYGTCIQYIEDIDDSTKKRVKCLVIPETVGQYTGLTDKNGVKIFEGQYLYVPYNKIGFVKVEFENGKYNAADYNLSKCTIHDNPELLKEGK